MNGNVPGVGFELNLFLGKGEQKAPCGRARWIRTIGRTDSESENWLLQWDHSGFSVDGSVVLVVDPLVCPRCGSPMRVLSVITEPQQVRKILLHLIKTGKAPPGLDPASWN